MRHRRYGFCLAAAALAGMLYAAPAQEKDVRAQQREEFLKDPQLAMWKSVKRELLGPDGGAYFDSSMKEALLPRLTGKIVKLEPALSPRAIVLAIEDGVTPDATLQFETRLPGKMDPGSTLSFEGVPQGYTSSPFMVVFNVDKQHVYGWTGKTAAARKRAVKK